MPRKAAGLTDAASKGVLLDGWGSAEVLDIDAIQVDPAYQRDLRHDLVNKIGQEFDMVKAGPILVSERADGTLWCVDGQHRMAGALQFGETEIFANVVRGLNAAEEAEIRLARNDRKPDTIYEKWRTRLAMGEEKVERMLEIVRQQGADLNLISANESHGINALAAIEVIYDIDEGISLGRTLRTIKEAFAEDRQYDNPLNPKTCSMTMLKATTWFLAQHVDAREATIEEFADKIGSVGIGDLNRKAVSIKGANGGSAWINYYRAFVEVWNFRRQEKNTLHWKTIGSLAQLGDKGSRAVQHNAGWRRDRG